MLFFDSRVFDPTKTIGIFRIPLDLYYAIVDISVKIRPIIFIAYCAFISNQGMALGHISTAWLSSLDFIVKS